MFGLRKCMPCRDKLFHFVFFNYTECPSFRISKKIILLYNVFLGRYLILYFKAITILWHYYVVAFESLDCNNNCQGCIYTTSVMNSFDSK